MAKGNNYPKYKLKRMVDGVLVLESAEAEAVAHMRAKGEADTAIRDLLEITDDQIKAIEADRFFTRRVDHLKKELTHNKASIPQTLDDYQQYALRRLYRLAQGHQTDVKSKIAAAKALGELANNIQHSADKTGRGFSPGNEPNTPSVKALEAAFANTGGGE